MLLTVVHSIIDEEMKRETILLDEYESRNDEVTIITLLGASTYVFH